MNSQQRQEVILNAMANLKEQYLSVSTSLEQVIKNKQKIMKMKREKAKAATLDPSQAANGSSKSK